MTRDAKTLYEETILAHGKHPRNEGALTGATHASTLHNPLCGDRVTLRLKVSGDRLVEVRFEARGCMIARASASLLTEIVAGQSVADALSLAATLEALVGEGPAPADVGPLEPLRGVRDFPARRTCATLAWDTLKAALTAGPEPRAT